MFWKQMLREKMFLNKLVSLQKNKAFRAQVASSLDLKLFSF